MPRTASLLATLVVAALPAAANDDGLKRCRTIPEATARLACYDAIPMAAPAPTRAPPPRAGPGWVCTSGAYARGLFAV